MTQFPEGVYPYSTLGLFTPGWWGLIFSKLLEKVLDLIWLYSEWVYGSFIKFPVIVSFSFQCIFFNTISAGTQSQKKRTAKQEAH